MDLRRRPILLAVAGIVAFGVAGSLFRSTHDPRSTPRPTEAQLRAFARQAPAVFRPLIALREGTVPPRSCQLPLAAGIAEGTRVRIVPPRLGSDGEYECHLGQYSPDGTYTPPRVAKGEAIDTAVYIRPGEHYELQLVTVGTKAEADPSRPYVYEGLLTEGVSVKQDLGPLQGTRSGYMFDAPHSMSDGFRIVQPSGPPPRRISLAPAELPPDTPAEPEGYALLHDQVALWRIRDARLPETVEVVNSPLLPYPFHTIFPPKRRTVTSQRVEYRVTGLAHVYRRRDSRWVYARSWSLEGRGTTTESSDHAVYMRVRRASGYVPSKDGAPTVLVADTAYPLER